MGYGRVMDDLSGRNVHATGTRRKRDVWWNCKGRSGVDSIRERGDGVGGGEVRVGQGRANDGGELGNWIGRRNGSYKGVDGQMLILSIRGSIVDERVHRGRKGRAASHEKKLCLTLIRMGSAPER